MESAQPQVILRLQNGDPLLIDCQRGLGRVVVCATSLDLSWSDLAVRRSFVPLMRGLVGHLSSIVQPPHNLAPGSLIIHDVVDDLHTDSSVLIGPDGLEQALQPGNWEGRRVRVSDVVHTLGVIAWVPKTIQLGTSSHQIEEYLFEGLSPDHVSRNLSRVTGMKWLPTTVYSQAFGDVSRNRIELWRWCVIAALGLLFLESWYTRPQSTGGRTMNKAAP